VHLAQHPDLPAGGGARSRCRVWKIGVVPHTAETLTAEISRGDATAERLAALTAAQAAAAEELEHYGGWDLVHRAEAILGHLGVADPSADVGCMSGGEQRRVALARVLIARPDLAVLDEPTNHLDLDAVEWLERHFIEEYPGALFLITHDRFVLDRVTTRTVELSRGRAVSYDGGYETYLQARAERLAHEENVERNRQRFLRAELDWLRRQPKARTTKAKARVGAEAALASERPRHEGAVELAASEVRTGKTILELRDLAVAFGGSQLVAPFTMHLIQGERIGIVGANGCGKTSLLRCVVGELTPAGGAVIKGATIRIAYLDQGRRGLDDDATVYENVIGDRGAVRVGDREVTPRAYLERFLFDYTAQRVRVGTLSGGERARVALAKLLVDPVNLLVLDEPTNDLDVATLGALETLLLEFGGTVLVVTHDRYFLDRVATSILAFEDGRVVRYHGTYSDYLRKRTRPAAQPKVESKPPPVQAAPQPKALPKHLRRGARTPVSAGSDRGEGETHRRHRTAAGRSQPLLDSRYRGSGPGRRARERQSRG
jgi:ATP-binding cassette subfamily F protein uup